MIKRASIFLSIVLVCVMAFALECSSGEKADVQYEVTISVVYNAVSPAEAERIAGVAMREHAGACKTDVKVKKVGSSGNDFITFSGSTPDIVSHEDDWYMKEIRVGSKVMAVNASHGWGRVEQGDIGIVKSYIGGRFIVDFPKDHSWFASYGDIELLSDID